MKVRSAENSRLGALAPSAPQPSLTSVRVALDLVGAASQGHHLVVRGVADGGVDVEVVDDEVGLEPPACSLIGGYGVKLGSAQGKKSWTQILLESRGKPQPAPAQDAGCCGLSAAG